MLDRIAVERCDVIVAEAATISRNAPCPCGSGLKYKHCHGQLA